MTSANLGSVLARIPVLLISCRNFLIEALLSSVADVVSLQTENNIASNFMLQNELIRVRCCDEVVDHSDNNLLWSEL